MQSKGLSKEMEITITTIKIQFNALNKYQVNLRSPDTFKFSIQYFHVIPKLCNDL